MPRLVYLVGVGLALVGLALAVTDWKLSLHAGVTERNVNRIRPGITIWEVETILGGPGTEESPVRVWFKEGQPFWWQGPTLAVAVFFTYQGRVERTWILHTGSTPPPSPLARLRAWLGW